MIELQSESQRQAGLKIVGFIALVFTIVFVILHFNPNINQSSIVSICTSTDPLERFFCPIGGYIFLIGAGVTFVIAVTALRQVERY